MIENTATVTYISGTATGTVTSNNVTIKVDELLDVAVAGLTTTPLAIGAASAALEYNITNTGNGPEAFNLSANPTVAGNNFDAVFQSIVIDSNGNSTYDPGVDAVLPAGSPTPSIAADGSLKVFVIVTLPAGAVDSQTSQVRLTASAATGTGTPGTAFAGQGQGGGDAVVGVSGASAAGLDALVASLASVSISKSVAILDPFGGTTIVPGSVVTYTLVATVSGTGQVSSLHVTDPFPSGTTYQPGTLKLDGTALSDASDTDEGLATATGIDVNLGTVSGGAAKTVKFDVKIN